MGTDVAISRLTFSDYCYSCFPINFEIVEILIMKMELMKIHLQSRSTGTIKDVYTNRIFILSLFFSLSHHLLFFQHSHLMPFAFPLPLPASNKSQEFWIWHELLYNLTYTVLNCKSFILKLKFLAQFALCFVCFVWLVFWNTEWN